MVAILLLLAKWSLLGIALVLGLCGVFWSLMPRSNATTFIRLVIALVVAFAFVFAAYSLPK